MIAHFFLLFFLTSWPNLSCIFFMSAQLGMLSGSKICLALVLLYIVNIGLVSLGHLKNVLFLFRDGYVGKLIPCNLNLKLLGIQTQVLSYLRLIWHKVMWGIRHWHLKCKFQGCLVYCTLSRILTGYTKLWENLCIWGI